MLLLAKILVPGFVYSAAKLPAIEMVLCSCLGTACTRAKSADLWKRFRGVRFVTRLSNPMCS
jgi:hypothetical protein